MDALFTATSAVCVTGRVVVDTGTAFTFFGQLIVLILIQVGGLGVMTFSALVYLMLGRRLSLASQAALHDTFFQRDLGMAFRQRFREILVIVGVAELTGALILLAALLWRGTPLPLALFSAGFHAVSAFCNAGFSLWADNLTGLRDSPVFVGTIITLIVLGGLGHLVLTELWERGRRYLSRRRESRPSLSLHSRVVLRTTVTLLFTGTVGLLVFGLTPTETTWTEKLSAALFQSVSARTAGFNTVDIGLLPLSSLLLLILLMFIGGSPGSCAGGVKTTALAISLAELRAKLRGEEEVVLLNRRVPQPVLDRAVVVTRLAVFWNLLGLLVLLSTEGGRAGVGFHHLLFEQISAFDTVGLSTGATNDLTVAGRLWIIATMFVGRVGPLTLALDILPVRPTHLKYPEDRILIG